MNMPLSNHVPSLQLCKKLKELNYPQEKSLFWWSFVSCGDGCKEPGHNPAGWMITNKKGSYDAVSAPLVSEMGEKLPPGFGSWKMFGGDFGCEDVDEHDIKPVVEKTEADARAKRLIHLLEQKLLTPEELK
jgi:hypothetical protein